MCSDALCACVVQQSALIDAPHITAECLAWTTEHNDTANVARVCWPFHQHPCFRPFVFYDLRTGREQRIGSSLGNELESNFVAELLTCLLAFTGEPTIRRCSIAVITPYRTQVERLRHRLRDCPAPLPDLVEVNTVDGFQGREKDIVIISCVRASKTGAIGFLQDERRMNVAITRARGALWICGREQTLR